MKKLLLEKESALSQQNLTDELARNRMRLAFEMEELQVLKSSPELLMLTPQAARLAEASQNLKNARTVISLTPQEAGHGSDLLTLFQELLQKAIDARKDAAGKIQPYEGLRKNLAYGYETKYLDCYPCILLLYISFARFDPIF